MRMLTCALVALLAAPALAAEYQLADLEALEKQGGWDELVEHMGDVLPSKRDAAWNGVAERGCVGLIASERLTPKTAEQTLDRMEKLLRRFPTLKRSKLFMAKRAEVGLNAFGMTYGNHRHSSGGENPWVGQLKDFVEEDTLTPDLPVLAAKKVQNFLTASLAWPFWRQALPKDTKGALCKDPDFQKSLVACFEDGAWKDEIQAPGSKCWAEIKKPVMEAFEKADRKAFRGALCPLLKAKKVKAEQCEEE